MGCHEAVCVKRFFFGIFFRGFQRRAQPAAGTPCCKCLLVCRRVPRDCARRAPARGRVAQAPAICFHSLPQTLLKGVEGKNREAAYPRRAAPCGFSVFSRCWLHLLLPCYTPAGAFHSPVLRLLSSWLRVVGPCWFVSHSLRGFRRFHRFTPSAAFVCVFASSLRLVREAPARVVDCQRRILPSVPSEHYD